MSYRQIKYFFRLFRHFAAENIGIGIVLSHNRAAIRTFFIKSLGVRQFFLPSSAVSSMKREMPAMLPLSCSMSSQAAFSVPPHFKIYVRAKLLPAN